MSVDTPVTPARPDHATRKPRQRVQAREEAVITVLPEADAAPAAGPSFADLGLPQVLVSTLARNNITAPFPIQAAAMPDALAGLDVLGRGQTGSGKTLAFGLPMLTRLSEGTSRSRHPRGLVLVPTRELAMQVQESLTPFASALNLHCSTVVGGTSFPKQISALRRGVDLLIATPGRLADHVRQGTCVLGDVVMTALDEADQMADMGFLPQVRELLNLVPQNGQRLLFSATLDGDVDKLVREYLHNPVTHSTAPASASVTTMDHHVLIVSAEDKPAIIAEVAAREGRTIMFARTKHNVDRLTKKLRGVGVKAGALHGGKTQNARTRTLAEFRDGTATVLVATDVAARGIHVDGISLVLHVDPPNDHKDYLHRAGRTARAGESGTVVTLVLHNQRRSTQALTGRAGVSPTTTRVRPGDPVLTELTGARQPSGVPLAEEKPDIRPSGRRGFGGQGRPERSGGGGGSRFRGARDSAGGAGGSGGPRRFESRQSDAPRAETWGGNGGSSQGGRPSWENRGGGQGGRKPFGSGGRRPSR